MPSPESPKDRKRRRLQEREWDAHRQDLELTRRYIEREGLCAILNDTKWEELVAAMRALGSPRFRQKHVRAEQPAEWDGEWYYHLRPFVCVEWVEIDLSKGAAEVEAALRAIPIPFSRERQYLRVWGYTRPGCSPVFA